MRADPTLQPTECWWVTLTCKDCGLPMILFFTRFGGSKKGSKIALFRGSKIHHFGSGPYVKNRSFKPNCPILRDAQFRPKSARRGGARPAGGGPRGARRE